MTITIEQLEHESKILPLRANVAYRAERCRVSFERLRMAMRELHEAMPYEHICSFSLTAPEIPPSPPEMPK